MPGFAIIGCGYVADLYMRSLALYPEARVTRVFDRDPERLAAFSSHWKLPAAASVEAFLDALEPGDIVLNLTNPASHHALSPARAGRGSFTRSPAIAGGNWPRPPVHCLARRRRRSAGRSATAPPARCA